MVYIITDNHYLFSGLAVILKTLGYNSIALNAKNIDKPLYSNNDVCIVCCKTSEDNIFSLFTLNASGIRVRFLMEDTGFTLNGSDPKIIDIKESIQKLTQSIDDILSSHDLNI